MSFPCKDSVIKKNEIYLDSSWWAGYCQSFSLQKTHKICWTRTCFIKRIEINWLLTILWCSFLNSTCLGESQRRSSSGQLNTYHTKWLFRLFCQFKISKIYYLSLWLCLLLFIFDTPPPTKGQQHNIDLIMLFFHTMQRISCLRGTARLNAGLNASFLQ